MNSPRFVSVHGTIKSDAKILRPLGRLIIIQSNWNASASSRAGGEGGPTGHEQKKKLTSKRNYILWDIMRIEKAKEITGSLSKPCKMPGHAYGLPAKECKTGGKLQKVKGSTCYGCYALKG